MKKYSIYYFPVFVFIMAVVLLPKISMAGMISVGSDGNVYTIYKGHESSSSMILPYDGTIGYSQYKNIRKYDQNANFIKYIMLSGIDYDFISGGRNASFTKYYPPIAIDLSGNPILWRSMFGPHRCILSGPSACTVYNSIVGYDDAQGLELLIELATSTADYGDIQPNSVVDMVTKGNYLYTIVRGPISRDKAGEYGVIKIDMRSWSKTVLPILSTPYSDMLAIAVDDLGNIYILPG